MTRDDLEQLLSKYVEMLAMRLAHEAQGADEVRAEQRMNALARRFPGSLREIDDLEMGEIRRRIDRLEGALRGEVAVERWMEAVALFHAGARGALCAKRWLAGKKRGDVDSTTQRAYAAAVPTLTFPEDASPWVSDLASVASPPRGRLMDLVFRRVATELATTEHEVRRLVFGVPRRERPRRRRA